MKLLLLLLIPLSISCSKNKQKCYKCTTITESKTTVHREDTSISGCGWSEDDVSNYEKANTSETASYSQVTSCVEE